MNGKTKTVQKVQLDELTPSEGNGNVLLEGNLGLIQGLKVRVSVSLGRSEMTVKELMALRGESVLRLDKVTTDPVDVFLEGRLIARGHLVVVGDNFGVRITEINQPE